MSIVNAYKNELSKRQITEIGKLFHSFAEYVGCSELETELFLLGAEYISKEVPSEGKGLSTIGLINAKKKALDQKSTFHKKGSKELNLRILTQAVEEKMSSGSKRVKSDGENVRQLIEKTLADFDKDNGVFVRGSDLYEETVTQIAERLVADPKERPLLPFEELYRTVYESPRTLEELFGSFEDSQLKGLEVFKRLDRDTYKASNFKKLSKKVKEFETFEKFYRSISPERLYGLFMKSDKEAFLKELKRNVIFADFMTAPHGPFYEQLAEDFLKTVNLRVAHEAGERGYSLDELPYLVTARLLGEDPADKDAVLRAARRVKEGERSKYAHLFFLLTAVDEKEVKGVRREEFKQTLTHALHMYQMINPNDPDTRSFVLGALRQFAADHFIDPTELDFQQRLNLSEYHRFSEKPADPSGRIKGSLWNLMRLEAKVSAEMAQILEGRLSGLREQYEHNQRVLYTAFVNGEPLSSISNYRGFIQAMQQKYDGRLVKMPDIDAMKEELELKKIAAEKSGTTLASVDFENRRQIELFETELEKTFKEVKLFRETYAPALLLAGTGYVLPATAAINEVERRLPGIYYRNLAKFDDVFSTALSNGVVTKEEETMVHHAAVHKGGMTAGLADQFIAFYKVRTEFRCNPLYHEIPVHDEAEKLIGRQSAEIPPKERMH